MSTSTHKISKNMEDLQRVVSIPESQETKAATEKVWSYDKCQRLTRMNTEKEKQS